MPKVLCSHCGVWNQDPGPPLPLEQYSCGHCHFVGTLQRIPYPTIQVAGPSGPQDQSAAVATGMVGAALGGAIGGPVGVLLGGALGALVGYKKPKAGGQ